METEPLLPKYILIFIGKDLIQNAHVFDYGMAETFKDILKWLLINIDRTLEVRKEDLYYRRPGAVSQSSEPCLIWVQMLRRPDHSTNKAIYSLSRKFNNVLDEVVSRNRHSHVLTPMVNHTSANFEYSGHISLVGKEEFWWNMDCQIRNFDHYKTELRPTPTPEQTPNFSFKHSNNKYKWHNKSNQNNQCKY